MSNELAITNIVDGYTISDLRSIASITVTYGYDAPTLELLLKNGDNTNVDGDSFGISIKSLCNQSNLNHRVVINSFDEKGLIDNETKELTAMGYLVTNGITKQKFGDMPLKELNKVRPLLEYRAGGWRIDRSHSNFQTFWDAVLEDFNDEEFNTSLKKEKHPQTEATRKLIKKMRKEFRDGV